MKLCGEVEIQLRQMEVSGQLFNPGETAPGTHYIDVWGSAGRMPPNINRSCRWK
jgi:hypothetical protein